VILQICGGSILGMLKPATYGPCSLWSWAVL